MRKFIYICLAAACFTSCNFLDTTVYDEVEQSDLYHDEETCLTGLAGIYDKLGHQALYGQYLWADLDAGTDIMVYNRSYGASNLYVSLYNYNNTDATLTDTWENLYEGINRANDYIDVLSQRTDEECGGAESKAMFIGEAKALRALFYMNLVAYWGEVPLRVTPTRNLTTQLLQKSPQADIYAQIIKDLTEAEPVCRPANELDGPGRISQTTVQALLARAYLWEAGYPVYADTWDEALTYARKVRDSGLHTLNRAAASVVTSLPTDYASNIGTGNNQYASRDFYNNGYCSLFINMCSNLYDLTARESMFEVEFYGNGLDQTNEAGKVGLYNGISWGQNTDPNTPFAYAWYDATKILLRLYDDGDARKWWNVADYTYSNDGNNRAVKTLRTNAQQENVEINNAVMNNVNPGKWRAEYDPVRPWSRNNSSINFPIMRYSDVLLMIAEAANEVNGGPTQEAIEAVNEVRGRAGASAISLGDYDQTGFRQFIFEERTRELCFETPRHQELRRMGREFFFDRIALLTSQELFMSNKANSIIGYPLDDVRAVPGLQIRDRHIYLPIPQSELNVNTICGQTEGW